jgi:NAD(P)-dependent dehydrogenase (short-subunit alcohol dehydrogenase family)
MGNLKNKIAVITGGNSGIGYAAARELKTRGATVIITGRRPEAVARAAAELGVYGITSDQSLITDTENLVRHVKEKFGKIDILFINAGIAGTAPIEQAT